jgi:hypothetical protein
MNNPRIEAMQATQTTGSDHLQYRVASKAAIVSVVFALMSALAFLFPVFVILPFLGICFGFVAIVNCRRYPNELSGKTAARIALAVSAVCLISATVMHSYIYATEVPEGYQRISFYELKPDKRSQTPFSEQAVGFNGEKVFLKGYVRPGMKQKRLRKFVLVGDFGSCCFGGNPKIHDVVAVTIKNDGDYVNYGYRLRRIGGEFKLHQKPKSVREKDLAYVLYEIEADYIK